MKTKLLLAVLITVIFSFNTVNAQSQKPKTFFMTVADSTCGNNAVGVNVRMNNFTNIIDFQGSINWDSAVLQYRGINFGNSVIALSPGDINQQLAHRGVLNFIWVDPTVLGQTVPDSTILFTLNFNIINTTINHTKIAFSNNPTPIQIDTISANLLTNQVQDTLLIGCTINILDSPTVLQNGNILICQAGCTVDTSYNSYSWYGYRLSGSTQPVFLSHGATYHVTPGQYDYYYVTATFKNKVLPSSPIQIVLPVNLKSFTATTMERNVTVKWQTTTEINTAYFNVQRSLNDKDFFTVYTLPAKVAGNYKYVDLPPVRYDQNIFYYRLEIVDINGTKTYSETKTANINAYSAQITISPNPSRDYVTISGKDITQIKIIDQTGRILKNINTVASSNTHTISVIGLPKSVYSVLTKTSDGTITVEKIVVY